MSKTKKQRRGRRVFTKEFKLDVARMCESDGIPAVSTRLDLVESSVRAWVRQAKIDAGNGAPGALATAEREELSQLRRELKRVTMERDILKKATSDSICQRNSELNTASGVANPSAFLGLRFRSRANLVNSY